MTSSSVGCKSFGMMLGTWCVTMRLKIMDTNNSNFVNVFVFLGIIHLNFNEY